MNRFIKLTTPTYGQTGQNSSTPLYIVVDKIACVSRVTMYTTVYTDEGQTYQVLESPDDVIKLITTNSTTSSSN